MVHRLEPMKLGRARRIFVYARRTVVCGRRIAVSRRRNWDAHDGPSSAPEKPQAAPDGPSCRDDEIATRSADRRPLMTEHCLVMTGGLPRTARCRLGGGFG